MEAIYFTQQGPTAYFAVISGFPLATVTANGQTYLPGDLAIDFGANGSFEYGVETIGTHLLYSGATWANPGFLVSAPYALAGGTSVGPVQFGYQSNAYSATGHYAFEVGIPISDFTAVGWTDTSRPLFDLHWTMSCGNDALDLVVPGSVVPEPTTCALMLLGLGGLTFRRRRA